MKRRAYSNLASYFEQSGDTQQAFADALGISQSHISRICKGFVEPSLDLALRIAAKANIPVETLVPDASQAQTHSGGPRG